MLDLVAILLFSLHLLAVNIASAAPLVCLWLKRRERRGDQAASIVGPWLARQANWSLAAGAVLGFAVLGLLWLGGERAYFQALAAVPRRRLWFGLAELVFFFACMGLYAWAWRRWDGSRWKRAMHAGLAILAATDLIYHFPPLFALVAVLRSQPDLLGGELSYRQTMQLMADTATLSRVGHFLLSSLAVTGAAMIAFALWTRRDAPVEPRERIVLWGARLALVPSLLQLLAGLFLLVHLPAYQRDRLLGGDPLSTVLLLASGLAMLGLYHHLAALALGETERRTAVSAVVLMLLVVLLMVAARHQSRGTGSERSNRGTPTSLRPVSAYSPPRFWDILDGRIREPIRIAVGNRCAKHPLGRSGNGFQSLFG